MVWLVCLAVLHFVAAFHFAGCSKHGTAANSKPPASPRVRSTKRAGSRSSTKREGSRFAVKKEGSRSAERKEESPPAVKKEEARSADKKEEVRPVAIPNQEEAATRSPCPPKACFDADTKKEEKFSRPQFDKDMPNILPLPQQPRKSADDELEIEVEIDPMAGEEGTLKKESQSQQNEGQKIENNIEVVKTLK